MKQTSNMFRTTLLATALVAPLVLTANTAGAADYPPPGDYAAGSRGWSENCARCHNIRGPKELRDDQWITTLFHMRVRAGLTGQETRDILTFMQTANNSTAPQAAPVKTSAAAASALSGREIYQQTCVACHGADGKGTVPGAPDFNRKDGRLSKSDDELMNSLLHGLQSPGSPMAMPPKGGNAQLTEEDLRRVLDYLREAFGS